MNGLGYLVFTQFKNSIKELPRKPGKLVLYILVILLIGFTGVSSFLIRQERESLAPIYWFKVIYFAFLTLFLILTIQKGVTSGDTIFGMEDVNFLFGSPINPRSILLYGLIRMTKTSFWAGFFILFQSSSLANLGIDYGGVLIIFATFIFSMVALSILSLIIYSVTNSNPRRKLIAKILTVVVYIPVVIYFAVQYLTQNDLIGALQNTINSILFNIIPFVGWTSAGTLAILEGNLIAGFGWLALVLLAGIGMIVYLLLSRSDYYEDVLVATETAFEKRRALQEGNMQAMHDNTSKVKVVKTGIGGVGSAAIFFKHMRENFRQTRFGFFNLYIVIMTVSMVIMAIATRDMLNVVTILMLLMWMEIMMIGMGRGLRELYTHYIYLIPEPPLKKIIWSNLEVVFRTLIESVLFIAVPGIIYADNILIIILAMLAYTVFAYFLLSVNYFSMRISDTGISQGIMIILYYLAILLIMAPGAAAAMIVGFSIGGLLGTSLGLVILAVWELILGTVFFALSKSVLHNCDMPTVKSVNK